METVASNMMTGLTQSANILVNKMKEKLSTGGKGGYPAAISNAISIGSPIQEGEGRYSIVVSIDLGKAPMAAAFEFGSGLQDIRSPSLYPIAAKNAPELKFFWKERGKWFKGTHLPFGHPGIHSRPYIRTSLQEVRAETIKILGDKFKVGILYGVREIWGR